MEFEPFYAESPKEILTGLEICPGESLTFGVIEARLRERSKPSENENCGFYFSRPSVSDRDRVQLNAIRINDTKIHYQGFILAFWFTSRYERE